MSILIQKGMFVYLLQIHGGNLDSVPFTFVTSISYTILASNKEFRRKTMLLKVRKR